MEAIKFDEHIGINLYRALSEEGLSEKDKAKIISEVIESIIHQFPNLKNTITNKELSEVELKLIKEISLIKKDTLYINENIKKLDLKITEIEERHSEKFKELDLKIEETKKSIIEVDKRLTKEIKEVELKLSKEIKEVELKLSKEIKEVELKLSKEIRDSKTDIIKWYIGLFIAQLGFIVAMFKLF